MTLGGGCRYKVEEDIALETMAGIMTSWIGALLLTTSGGKQASELVKRSEADIVNQGQLIDENTCFGHSVHCILGFIKTLPPSSGGGINQQPSSFHASDLLSMGSHDPLHTAIPHMYLRASSQGEDENGSSGPEPLVPRRVDPNLTLVWDFCWEHLARGSDEGKRLALFRPLLLHICSVAKNMIQVNSFYLCDMGLIDY